MALTVAKAAPSRRCPNAAANSHGKLVTNIGAGQGDGGEHSSGTKQSCEPQQCGFEIHMMQCGDRDDRVIAGVGQRVRSHVAEDAVHVVGDPLAGQFDHRRRTVDGVDVVNESCQSRREKPGAATDIEYPMTARR